MSNLERGVAEICNMGCVLHLGLRVYRGTSLIRNRFRLGPYSRTMPRVIQRTWGGLQFLMSEVPLYA